MIEISSFFTGKEDEKTGRLKSPRWVNVINEQLNLNEVRKCSTASLLFADETFNHINLKNSENKLLWKRLPCLLFAFYNAGKIRCMNLSSPGHAVVETRGARLCFLCLWAVRRWQASRKEVHQSLHHKQHSTATRLFQGRRIICIIWATFTLKRWFYFRFTPVINCRFHALRANWNSSYLFMIMKWLTWYLHIIQSPVSSHTSRVRERLKCLLSCVLTSCRKRMWNVKKCPSQIHGGLRANQNG